MNGRSRRYLNPWRSSKCSTLVLSAENEAHNYDEKVAGLSNLSRPVGEESRVLKDGTRATAPGHLPPPKQRRD
jgi:hypothetical protein